MCDLEAPVSLELGDGTDLRMIGNVTTHSSFDGPKIGYRPPIIRSQLQTTSPSNFDTVGVKSGTLSLEVDNMHQQNSIEGSVGGEEMMDTNTSSEAYAKLMISMASMARPGSFEEARGGNSSTAASSRFGKDVIIHNRGGESYFVLYKL